MDEDGSSDGDDVVRAVDNNALKYLKEQPIEGGSLGVRASREEFYASTPKKQPKSIFPLRSMQLAYCE